MFRIYLRYNQEMKKIMGERDVSSIECEKMQKKRRQKVPPIFLPPPTGCARGVEDFSPIPPEKPIVSKIHQKCNALENWEREEHKKKND